MKNKSLVLLFLIFSIIFVKSQSFVLPEGFVIETVVQGLKDPTDIVIAKDGRIFITEKEGKVRIVENGVLLSTPMYTVETQTPNERGLDGIVLDPNFDVNNQFYIYYTLPTENRNKVSRVTAIGNSVVPQSELELMRFDPMWGSWHNGAGMAFDETGKLIIGIGDGTGGNNGQSLNSTLAKLIRLNTDGTIPVDNPFYTILSGNYRAIAAYGVRNPYTMAKSKRTGKIFFNDVGTNKWEEINEFKIGKNYGWNILEGYLGDRIAPDSNYIDPIYAYDHKFGCAIVGAGFYEPSIPKFPTEYDGKYFFLEYCKGYLMYMDPVTYETKQFMSGFEQANNLEVGDDGSIYVIDGNAGKLYKISYSGNEAPPVISKDLFTKTVVNNTDVTFQVESNGKNLSYKWFENNVEIVGQNSSQLVFSNVTSAKDKSLIYVIVSNDFGSDTSKKVVLNVVQGSAPNISINLSKNTYSAGDTLRFSASITDIDQDDFDARNVEWRIDFHHNTHIHPAMPTKNGIFEGEYVVETNSETSVQVYFKIHLKVTDSTGLISEDSKNINPNIREFLVRSSPKSNFNFSIDGETFFTNQVIKSVDNLVRNFKVEEYQVNDGYLYQFDKWVEKNKSENQVSFNADIDTITLVFTEVSEYFSPLTSLAERIVFKDTGTARVEYKRSHYAVINENWDILNPYRWDSPKFPDDYWSERWVGKIIAPITADYTFYLRHDGRVKLELDGKSQIFNSVVNYSRVLTDSFTVHLKGGGVYPIIIDYDHFEYISILNLKWKYLEKTPSLVVINKDDLIDGIFKQSLDLKSEVFPNPSNQRIKISFSSNYNEGVDLEVIDINGVVKMKRDNVLSDEIELEISSLLSGIYIIKIINESFLENLIFIKN